MQTSLEPTIPLVLTTRKIPNVLKGTKNVYVCVSKQQIYYLLTTLIFIQLLLYNCQVGISNVVCIGKERHFQFLCTML